MPSDGSALAGRRNGRWALRQLGHLGWSIGALARRGWPPDLFLYAGGIGDELLCTAVFHELTRRGHPAVRVMSAHPGLFENNPDVREVLPPEARWVELAERLGRRVVRPRYTLNDLALEDHQVVPPGPLIAAMCESAGITGDVQLRPYLWLTDEERAAGRLVPRQVAIVSSGLSARTPMRNKQWFPERFQEVVRRLKDEFDFVQLGDAPDPLLEGALDLRGKTTIRQSAAILSRSLCLVGHVGFLMHLARAVDCRAAIVYGGREHPSQSGYVCNENLYTSLPCAPCWNQNGCPLDRQCLRLVTPEMVVAAVRRQADRQGRPLEVETYTIHDTGRRENVGERAL